MPTGTKITFPGALGSELAARLDLPPTPPRALVLFAHCFTCGKDIAAASRISAGLVAEGFGVLRFDFTGLGSSEGEFANTHFSSNVADLVAAADMLRGRYQAPTVLIGHSLGGAAVLAAGPQIPEVQAVVTLAAPSEPAHVAGVFDAESLDRIREHGEAEVHLAGRPFRIRREFLDDIAEHQLGEAIRGLRAALLVLHSPVDELVSVEHARHIYEAARHPKSFVSLDGADHLLTKRRDAAYVARLIAAWASRYLPGTEESSSSTPQPPEGHVVVEEAGTGTFAQHVHAGRHTIRSDEPVGIGDDTGPTPYDLLLGALGSCTAMTLRMYARRKKVPLEHASVTLSHERRHADDCAETNGGTPTMTVISRTVELVGDELTPDERAKLLEIADKCPVHRTLEGPLSVETTLTADHT